MGDAGAEVAAKTPRQSMAYGQLQAQLDDTRALLSTVQRELAAFGAQHKQDMESLQRLLGGVTGVAPGMRCSPIGFLETVFHQKNGTPRQGCVCPGSSARLRIQTSRFTNPEHSLDGLGDFSHAWILFEFHENANEVIRPKVRPPRLDGERTGLFSTRTPHRPNALGLSLVRIESVQGDTVVFSGIDIINGTPVLDIKPYIPYTDVATGDVRVAAWLHAPPIPPLNVVFTAEAEAQLESLGTSLGLFSSVTQAHQAICDILRADPRSVYRRNKCTDRPYWVRLDTLNITCWFDATTASVTEVELWQGELKGRTAEHRRE